MVFPATIRWQNLETSWELIKKHYIFEIFVELIAAQSCLQLV